MTNFTEVYGLIECPRRITRAFRTVYPPLSGQCEMPDCRYQNQRGYLAQLVYDHCHDHGIIRGTICGYSNRDLGRYQANIRRYGRGHKAFDTYILRCPECRKEIEDERI